MSMICIWCVRALGLVLWIDPVVVGLLHFGRNCCGNINMVDDLNIVLAFIICVISHQKWLRYVKKPLMTT